MMRLPSDLEQNLRLLLEGGDPAVIAERVRALPPEQIAELLAALHPADSADVLEELDSEQQRDVFAELEPEDAAEVLAYLESDEQADIVTDLAPAELAHILDEMEPDDAAEVIADLPDAQASAALAQMDEAEDIRTLLRYQPQSAGRLMTTNVIALRADTSVADALAHLRQLNPDDEVGYYLYVTDADLRLVGVVGLRRLLTADLATTVRQVMDSNVVSVSVDTSQEEAAHILSRYSLMALPAVDGEGRLVGAITADDALDVVREEATEDLYRLANLDVDENVSESVTTTSRRRLTWLLVNLPTAMLAGAIVSQFEGTVERVAVLAVFMPIIAGMGGNAGIQTLTLIVRSIALGELRGREAWRSFGREALVGVINGLCFGIVIGLVGFLWKGLPILGLVAGIAMLANMIAAALAGTLVPLTLRRLGADPALASGVIVTTFTDVTGYSCFLGLATLLIHYFPITQ